MKLSVIIVSYNVKYFLEQCLRSVAKAAALVETEIWVVDNHSADGSADLVRDSFPQVNLICNDNNPGFSKANNQAIHHAKGEYILLLNPDTLVEEDTFLKIVQYMDAHPEAGGLGVYMIDGRGNFLPESKRALPTPEVAFYKLSGLSRLFPKSKRFGRYHLGYLDKEQIHEVEVLSGAFMLLRKSTIDEIGVLDEDYFMYGEDIDISYRITKGGYTNVYFPETRIIHYKGESTRKTSANYVLVFYNAMRIFARKHFSGRHASLFNLLITAAIFARAGLALLSRLVSAVMMPFLDILILYSGLSFFRFYWEEQVHRGEDFRFPEEVQTIAFPAFIVVWLATLALAGGYVLPIRLARILKGVFAGSAIILLAYSILPEALRFSRALVLLGSAWAVIALPLIRIILHQVGIKQSRLEQKTEKRLAVAGGKEEYDRVRNLLSQSTGKVNLTGRIAVSPDDHDVHETLGNISRIGDIIGLYKLDEVIFCARDIPSQDIINMMNLQSDTRIEFKIAPPESLYIIGSSSIHDQGELYGIHLNSISRPLNRRSKRAFDIIFALLLLLTLPIHLVIMRDRMSLIRNIFRVLSGSMSWVGYVQVPSEPGVQLPPLREGILNPADHFRNTAAGLEGSARLNQLYAKDYNWQGDLNLVLRNYKKLSVQKRESKTLVQEEPSPARPQA